MAERLPVIDIGVAASEEDRRILDDAVRDLVARWNEVPEHLSLNVLCSVVVSVCCSQDDPAAIFGIIGENAGLAIAASVAEPKGSG